MLLMKRFYRDVADEEILQVLKKTLLTDYALLLAHAKASSISDSWVTILEEFLRRNQGCISLVGAHEKGNN